jgi:hypothetical protein
MTWAEKYVLRRRIKVFGLWVLVAGFLLGILDYPLQALVCFCAAFIMVGWALNDENNERQGPTGTA